MLSGPKDKFCKRMNSGDEGSGGLKVLKSDKILTSDA